MLVAVNAAVAITALVVGEFGQTPGRVLGTSMLATAGCVGVLVNVPAMRGGRAGQVPAVAAGFALVTAGLLIAGMWAGFRARSSASWRRAARCSPSPARTPGWCRCYRCAGGSARCRRLHMPWSALTAAVLTFIWLEVDDATPMRVVGVGAVLLAAETLALPVLVRQAQPAALPTWHCPRCRREVPAAAAGERIACAGCGVEFAVFDGGRDAGGADGPADAGRRPPLRAAAG